jgi:hypothetical protein
LTSSVGDLAAEVTNGLVTETQAPVTDAAVMTEEADTRASNSLFNKIRFNWRPEDRAILERVRIAGNTKFQEMHGSFINTIDKFYESLWVPERHLPDGRTVWKTDHQGNPVEDWNQLTGQDIEQTLMNLQRIKLHVAPMINDLFLNALYARHVASDVYDDTYTSLLDGTQGDRSARSNRESREDRYHAYFHYHIWSTANTFLQEVNQFMIRLEKIRQWQTWGKQQ